MNCATSARDIVGKIPTRNRSPTMYRPVGGLFVRQSCTLVDSAHQRRVELKVNLYRKPGQSAFNPQMSTQLTQGQFESSARLEIYDTGGK